jgi:hypothetical protein
LYFDYSDFEKPLSFVNTVTKCENLGFCEALSQDSKTVLIVEICFVMKEQYPF